MGSPSCHMLESLGVEEAVACWERLMGEWLRWGPRTGHEPRFAVSTFLYQPSSQKSGIMAEPWGPTQMTQKSVRLTLRDQEALGQNRKCQLWRTLAGIDVAGGSVGLGHPGSERLAHRQRGPWQGLPGLGIKGSGCGSWLPKP